jgi:hypothetical protein
VRRLRGEHDLTTSTGVREALAPIQGNVLVDLSDRVFLDSSVPPSSCSTPVSELMTGSPPSFSFPRPT